MELILQLSRHLLDQVRRCSKDILVIETFSRRFFFFFFFFFFFWYSYQFSWHLEHWFTVSGQCLDVPIIFETSIQILGTTKLQKLCNTQSMIRNAQLGVGGEKVGGVVEVSTSRFWESKRLPDFVKRRFWMFLSLYYIFHSKCRFKSI